MAGIGKKGGTDQWLQRSPKLPTEVDTVAVHTILTRLSLMQLADPLGVEPDGTAGVVRSAGAAPRLEDSVPVESHRQAIRGD